MPNNFGTTTESNGDLNLLNNGVNEVINIESDEEMDVMDKFNSRHSFGLLNNYSDDEEMELDSSEKGIDNDFVIEE